MIISNVNIGSGPGANDGESIYSAFYKVNQNFANVQSNVNSLTNSVSSVAGRTGNVTLTINDIVGLNTSYALNGNVTAANIGMKGYVDAKIAANVAALVDSAPGALDTLNELAAALNDDASFATTIVNTVTLANTIQSQQIVAANLGMKGYVDSQISVTYSNINTLAYLTTNSYATQAYVNLANTSLKSYVDGQITSANSEVTAANLGMKGYVDSVASQSIFGNANVASYLHENNYNPYSNVNVASYLPTYGGNIKVSSITNNGNAIHLYSTLHIQGDEGGNGLFVGDPNVEITPYGNTIASFHGNVNAPVYLNVHNTNTGDKSITGIAISSDIGDTSDNNMVLAIFNSGYTDTSVWPNVKPGDCLIDSTEGNLWIGTVDKSISFYIRDYIPEQVPLVSINNIPGIYRGNLNIHRSVDLSFLDANSVIRFGDGSIQTTAYTGYGNTHVGAYTNLSTYAYNANVTAANIGMKGYVDSIASQSTYGNANVASYLPTYGGNIKVTGILNGGNAIHIYNTLHIQGDEGGNGLFVGDPNVEIAPYGNTIASFHGNVNGPIYLNVHNKNAGAQSLAGIALTSDIGDTFNDSLILAAVGSGYSDTLAWPNVQPLDSFVDSTEGNLWIGTVGKTITFYTRNYFPDQIPLVSIDNDLAVARGNLNIHRYVDLNFLDSNSKIYFGDGSVQTTAYTGSTYSNVQVATYLPTHTGNVQAGNVKAVTAYRFATGAVTITNGDSHVELSPDTGTNALAGVKVGGNGYILGPNASRCITLNYGSVGGAVGLQSNVTIGTGGSGNLVVLGRVTAGNITANYISGDGSAITSLSGAQVSGNVAEASLAYTVNISPVIVNLEYQLALLPAKEGAWGIKAADGTANVTYNPVSNRLTSANIQATGSIQTSGINGRIGYSAGGFVQQITANSNGVSLNTVTGNIQLMGINLGVNGLHTVALTNNKLEETDMILVSHHSGGVSNFAVGAYYAAPSTAIIWIRNITGADTSTVTPMLKFALIKAPGA